MKTSQLKSVSEAARTVLVVDEHGRMRTINSFHQKVRIGIILFVCALLAAAGAGWLYIDALRTQQALRQQIDVLERRAADAEHQKELLLARAVRAEAQIAPPETARASVSSARRVPSEVAAAEARRPPAPADEPAADQPPVKPEAAPAASSSLQTKPEPAVGVAVEKLTVVYQPSGKVVASEFTIRNTGHNQAQGRAVVVLSAEEGGPSPRLSLPAVPLNNGRPQGDTGSRFAIRNFMRLKMQRKASEPGLRFDTAEVFVFDMQGRLLQEKSFAIKLQIPDAEPPEQDAAAAADRSARPAAGEAPASDSIIAIPSNSRQEPQGGQENE